MVARPAVHVAEFVAEQMGVDVVGIGAGIGGDDAATDLAGVRLHARRRRAECRMALAVDPLLIAQLQGHCGVTLEADGRRDVGIQGRNGDGSRGDGGYRCGGNEEAEQFGTRGPRRSGESVPASHSR